MISDETYPKYKTVRSIYIVTPTLKQKRSCTAESDKYPGRQARLITFGNEARNTGGKKWVELPLEGMGRLWLWSPCDSAHFLTLKSSAVFDVHGLVHYHKQNTNSLVGILLCVSKLQPQLHSRLSGQNLHNLPMQADTLTCDIKTLY